MSDKKQRIGILTSGGDCPGLNAVIRGVTKPALRNDDMEIIGINDGFEGMVEGKMSILDDKSVSGIINIGGTILGTSNRADPFHYPVDNPKGVEIIDASKDVVYHYNKWELDCLIAIGGDGTMHISNKLIKMGMNIIGVPKTIDNDLDGTDVTFGFDTARNIATEAIDRLHTTASSHHRVMVCEVMGRYAGWIALEAGIAGGGDIILLPEIPFCWEAVYDKVRRRERTGKRFSIIVVSEGAHPEGEDMVVREKDESRTDPIQLGGIGKYVGNMVEKNTGLESRVTVLGHLQRGGSPSAFDRILSTRYGTRAITLAKEKNYNRMVALKSNEIVDIPLENAIKKQRVVSPDSQIIQSAKLIGTCFGECLE
ncbi:MAG: 6-phosphofructokinase [Candidatus Zixiibacteriota bacterium]